jgi:rhodanese-related sulfurtransferase
MKLRLIFKGLPMAVLLSATLFAADEQSPTAKTAPATAQHAKAHYQNIDPAKFDQIRTSDTNSVVLDVRTRKEYRDGHIPGSVLLDFNSPDFDQQVAKLDKNKTYLVHCASGGRSSRACKKMEQMDFSKLYNLKGGMNAWEKAGKPVEK